MEGVRKSIGEILEAWTEEYVPDERAGELYSIDFPAGSAFEDEEGNAHGGVSRLAFQAGLIDAFRTKSRPAVDFQLQQALARKYVLTRVDGSPVFESFFSDLSLGLWSEVEVGKYYSNPALGFFYFCGNISDNLVTWVVVESYQHGRLMQARYTQKEKFSGQYVPVTDKEKLAELKKIYTKLRRSENRHGDRKRT